MWNSLISNRKDQVRVCKLWDKQLLINIIRKSTPRITESLSLVLIRQVLTEIQRFRNVKIKCMAIRTLCALCAVSISLTLSNGCLLVGIGYIYTKLGDFVKLTLHFTTRWINSCLSHNLETRTQSFTVWNQAMERLGEPLVDRVFRLGSVSFVLTHWDLFWVTVLLFTKMYKWMTEKF